MAIIGRIRNYSGLVIAVVGVALAAFILGDFYKKGRGGHSDVDMGVVNGEKISRVEFEKKVAEIEEQVKEQQKEQTGQEKIEQSQIFQIRQEVWDKMTKDILMGDVMEQLGITVTSDELNDWIRGNNPHRMIRQYFTNPETGQFDKMRVDQIVQNFDKLDPKFQKQWRSLEKAIQEDVLNTKFANLISKAIYVPKALAKFDFESRNRKAHIRFVSVKYNSISDKEVKFTDDDLKKYYDEHSYEYVQDEESRDMDYVVYDVLPSNKDISKAEKEVAQIKTDLATTTDFNNFFNLISSDSKYDSSFHKKGFFPLKYDTLAFKIEPGTIIGPIRENSKYFLAKLLKRESRPDSLRASHILIAYTGSRAGDKINRTKVQAKKMADSLAVVLKKDTAKFKEVAAKFSNDPSVQKNGGDLNWFQDGAMVPEFNDACIKGKIGDIVVKETVFGYHVIRVTGKTKPIEKAKVAMIEHAVQPSNETIDSISKIAYTFAGEIKDEQSFNNLSNKKGLNKRVAQYVKAMDNSIASIESPRDVIRWAYDENTKKGDFKLFEINGEPNKYVIVMLKETHKKGIAPLELVKKEIESKVILEKKAEKIIEKINKLNASKDVYRIASALKEKVDTTDILTLASYSIPTTGPEPEVIGKIFTMKPNTVSAPIIGKTGVYVVMMDNFIEPPVNANNNYKESIMMIERNFSSRVNYDLFNDMKRNTEIKDNRINFY